MVAVLVRVQDAGQGAEGVLSDLGVDGGLPVVLVPHHPDVESCEQACLQSGWQAGQDVPCEGELIEQVRVDGPGGGLVQILELGFDLLAFVVEVGEPGADAGPEGGGCGVVRVGGDLLEFQDLGVLGDVDLPDAGVEGGGLGVPAFGRVGVGGGELLSEEPGPVGAEDPGGEEDPGGLVQARLRDLHGAGVVRLGGDVAGVGRVVGPCFARPEPWLQAGKYLSALAGGLARRNGWTIAEQAGDRAPDKTQRLLNRAVWDTSAAMGAVRRFAVAGLEQAARRSGRRDGLVTGALDETGQEKSGQATAGVQRQYLGCAGKVANGINTVHLAYVREHAGHALIGARQWIPAAQIDDPARSAATGLPAGLEFRTKGQLAIDIAAEALADGVCFDFFCGDEVYGSCTELREFLEGRGQAYVLRVARNFRLTLPGGQRLTCADAAGQLAAGHCEVRSAGTGARGQRWYGWSWLATASAQHYLLIRRHLRTGELAFHYCFVPEGQPGTITRLIRAAGLRWPVEEQFRAGKDLFGLDESQVRLYTAIARHTVLVMAALAICAVTAAQLRHRTDTQAAPPVRPASCHPPTPAWSR